MKAVILSIGDELVLGQTVDTNSAWLSRQLAAIGCDCLLHLTIADSQAMTAKAIRDNAPLCDLLLITGGLGPTADDLTRQALAEVLHQPLELNQQWLDAMQHYFRERGRPFSPSNRIQAMVPRGAQMLYNTCGTACGIAARLDSCDLYAMPGVPREMEAMFQRDILPHISAAANGSVILSRTLHTFGIGESRIGEMLGTLMDRTRNPSVGTTVSGGVVSLRLNSRFPSPAQAREQLDATDAACREVLGDLIYGQDNVTLPLALAQLLKANGKTLTTAESCTGGLLAGMLTEIPGSSAYFRQGWVTYTNQSKTALLGVRSETLAQYGAVSVQTVEEMAQGARERAATDFALSISGIAGPDGATPDKPVGTVCIGLAYPGGAITRCTGLFGGRDQVRDRACKTAFTMLRYHLLGKAMPV